MYLRFSFEPKKEKLLDHREDIYVTLWKATTSIFQSGFTTLHPPYLQCVPRNTLQKDPVCHVHSALTQKVKSNICQRPDDQGELRRQPGDRYHGDRNRKVSHVVSGNLKTLVLRKQAGSGCPAANRTDTGAPKSSCKGSMGTSANCWMRLISALLRGAQFSKTRNKHTCAVGRPGLQHL